ncbi:EAL domain-containing protein [Spiroplasma endosymbiont of Labia minor]|uniref:EAL domain-containing protein n=1 Tax=Spiroplasma endosymbiont of Labia minor TaxID=3066305 RepID=UPI0030D53B4B
MQSVSQNLGNWIIIALSFTLILVVIYATIFGFTRHIFERNKIFYHITLGLIFGLTSILFYLISILKLPLNNLGYFLLINLLIFLVFWICLVFISIYTALIVASINAILLFLLPNVVENLFSIDFNLFNILIIVLAYVTTTTLWIISRFFKILNLWWQWSIATVILLSFGLILQFIELRTEKNIASIIILLIDLSFSYFAYFILQFFETIYLHAKKLQNLTSYNHTYFVREAMANHYLSKKINNGKIKYGYYLMYFIDGFESVEKKIDNLLLNTIIESIADQSYKYFSEVYKDLTFFKINYRVFGVFIPIEFGKENWMEKSLQGNFLKSRPIEDELSKLETVFKKIKTIFLIDEYLLKLKLKGVVSIYGITSNDINKLQSINTYFSHQQLTNKYENKLLLVDSAELKHYQDQDRKVSIMRDITNIAFNSIVYYSICGIKSGEILGYYLKLMIQGEFIQFQNGDDNYDQIVEYNLESIYIRYIANLFAESVEKNRNIIKNKLTFIQYDSLFASSKNFNIEEFLNKLNNHKIRDLNLVFTFNINSDAKSFDLLKENIGKIKNAGYKIALNNVGIYSIQYELLNVYKPNYIILDSKVTKEFASKSIYKNLTDYIINICKKLEISIIASDIDGFFKFKQIQNYNIDYAYGNIIGSSLEPKYDLDKEARYILFKEKNNSTSIK